MIERHLPRVAVLVVMHEEAYSGRGWSRRGVRGWRFREEVESVAGTRLPEVLPYLAGRGWLDRIDVREPGRGRHRWIYRISQRGARVIERLLDWGRYEISEAWPFDTINDLRALYAPAGAWRALLVLRRQTALTNGTRRFGAPGWMTVAEVRRASPSVLTKDLGWLLEHGLIERRRPIEPGTPSTGGLWFYRITARGMRALAVDAARIQDDPPMFVQIEIPEAEEDSAREADATRNPALQADGSVPPATSGTGPPVGEEPDRQTAEPDGPGGGAS